MALIRTIMKRNIVSLPPTAFVSEVIHLMGQNRMGSVLVVEKEQLAGIVTKWDLLEHVLVHQRNPAETNLLSVYTRNPVTVLETTPVQECIDIIRTHNFRHLPVVNAAHHPVGIISTRDFLQFVAYELEGMIDRSIQSTTRLPPKDVRFELSLNDALHRLEKKQKIH